MDIVEFVVHTHSQRVRSAIDNHIIGKGYYPLRQVINTSIAIISNIHRNATRSSRILDYHAWQIALHIGAATILHTRKTYSQRVVNPIRHA